MSNPSHPAPQDEPDMNSVFRALSDPRVAQVAALVPDTHPIVRTVAAFHGNL